MNPTPAEQAAALAYAEKQGREHAKTLLAQQAVHSQFWRDYLAGKIVLTVPGYE